MDEELQNLIKQLRAHHENLSHMKNQIASYDDSRTHAELRERINKERKAMNRIIAELIEYSEESVFHDFSKPGSSLIWDARGKYREQKWPELKERILNTQGGIGIVADDFIEMLRYRPAPYSGQTQTLRDSFAALTRDATELEDIQLLAEILSYMLRDPWAANIDGGWFIYYLEGKDTRDIDLERAVAVINFLQEKNSYAAAVLCQTLSSFSYGPDLELVIDLLLNTDKFSVDVINTIKTLSLNPPRKGERKLISYPHLFLSYSRLDITLMRTIRSNLTTEGFKTWTDEMLEPGTPQWQSAIEQAIKDCGALVVILTPNSYQSTWVKREINFSLMQDKRIFPILAEGDESTSIPVELVMTQHINLTKDFQPNMSKLAEAIRRFLVTQHSNNSK